MTRPPRHNLQEGIHYTIKTRERDIDIHPDIAVMAPSPHPWERVRVQLLGLDIDHGRVWEELKEAYGDDVIPRLEQLDCSLNNLGSDYHTRLVIHGLFLVADEEDLMQILDPDRVNTFADVVNEEKQELVECGYCGDFETEDAFLVRSAHIADTLEQPLEWTFHHLTFGNQHRTVRFLPDFLD